MPQYPFASRTENTSLNVYQCSKERCREANRIEQFKQHYLFHFIRDGKGCYWAGNQRYLLGAGQGFLICPQTHVYYYADREDPWQYAWVEFDGHMAADYLSKAGLNESQLIYQCNDRERVWNALDEMIRETKKDNYSSIRLTGLMYLFTDSLIQESKLHLPMQTRNPEEHVRIAVNYMMNNYNQKITVEQIAEAVGVNRSYLYEIFKQKIGMSPQRFLISRRVEAAKLYLEQSDMSLEEIAVICGYEDPFTFSKAFKKMTGKAPSRWKDKK